MIWLHSMHQCAVVHNQMTMITGMQHKTSEQHIKLGKSRNIRDFKDLLKVRDWFERYNPFSKQQPKLYSLSTGYTSEESDDINCDKAEEIRFNIHKDLDCKSLDEAKNSSKKQVKTLKSLKKGISIDNQTVFIDPSILFNRLTILMQRTENISHYFQYDLTPLPTSLFMDTLM